MHIVFYIFIKSTPGSTTPQDNQYKMEYSSFCLVFVIIIIKKPQIISKPDAREEVVEEEMKKQRRKNRRENGF